MCRSQSIDVVLNECWEKGGEGGIEMAERLVEIVRSGAGEYKPLYGLNDSLQQKVETIAQSIYGADSVVFSAQARKEIKKLEKYGYDKLPVCMAKTQYSLSDNPDLLGEPKGFKITVKDVRVSAGAGFVVCLTGDIMTMPGLPKIPAANVMDIDQDGKITGLF